MVNFLLGDGSVGKIRFRNKQLPWITFDQTEQIFVCERCKGIRSLIRQNRLKKFTDEFVRDHANCKEGSHATASEAKEHSSQE